MAPLMAHAFFLTADFDVVYWIQFMACDLLVWEIPWLALVHTELVGPLVNQAMLHCTDFMITFSMHAVIDVS